MGPRIRMINGNRRIEEAGFVSLSLLRGARVPARFVVYKVRHSSIRINRTQQQPAPSQSSAPIPFCLIFGIISVLRCEPENARP